MGLKKEREELSQKTVAELEVALRAAKRDLLVVRTNIATRKEEDNNRSKMLRRRIARIMTYMAQKKREEAKAGAAPGHEEGR